MLTGDVNLDILAPEDWPRMEIQMDDIHEQMLVEMERDALRMEQDKAEMAMFNVIEAVNELNRIDAEGAVQLHSLFGDVLKNIDIAIAKLAEGK